MFASNVNGGNFNSLSVLVMIGKFITAIIILYGLARYLVPRFLRFVASTHSKELFSIAILCISLGIAGLTHQMGLSLALGAFLAGLVVSESDFGNQAASEVLPLRDAFSAIFFVSIGMLLDLNYVGQSWPTIFSYLVIIVVVKFFLIFGITFAFRYPVKICTFVALALSQIGEFSFLLLQAAQKENLLSRSTYQLILANAILTILATPYLLKTSGRIKKVFAFLNKTKWITRDTILPGEISAKESNEQFQNHLIICGCGR
jgi:CPA2 family monovalent cation:H+ antiporter-2